MPESYNCLDILFKRLPFVVKVISFKSPCEIKRERFEIKSIKPFLARGSPPLSLIFFIPLAINNEQRLSISSKVNKSSFGRNFMFSGIQYVQRKLHLSVTDILR